MQIKINLPKKHFLAALVIMAMLTIGVLVYAFGTNNPQFFGHSADEVYIDDMYTLALSEVYVDDTYTLKDAYTNIISRLGNKLSASDAEIKLNQLNDRYNQLCSNTPPPPSQPTCPADYGYEINKCYPLNNWTETKTFTVTVPGETIDTGYGIVTMPDALFEATAESRIGSDGKREVRITQCSASPIYPGSCTADWADDSALCEYYVHDVTRMACYAVTTSRYSVKVFVGNNYAGGPTLLRGGFVILGSFGPETTLGTVATPYDLTGAHSGSCSLSRSLLSTSAPINPPISNVCSLSTFPAKCIDGTSYGYEVDQCGCEAGFRLLDRVDLGGWTYECIKD